VAEADGNRTRLTGIPGHYGVEDRARHQTSNASGRSLRFKPGTGGYGGAVGLTTRLGARIGEWSLLRQATGRDRLGRGEAARSDRSRTLAPRTGDADRVVDSVCPFCAVGCAQKVFVKDGRITQVEGNPASPISRGRLCPKGSATMQLVTSPTRVTKVRYRRPHGTEWEDLDLDTAMDMIADRVIRTRKQFWEWENDGPGGKRRTRRTLGIASLGGATLDNEENYLMKKLYTAMGAIQIENQARI
jgi:formate dehydrogenase major subunit